MKLSTITRRGGIFGSAFIFVAIATIEVLCAISLMLGYKVRLSAAIMAASLLISLLFLFPGKGFGTPNCCSSIWNFVSLRLPIS